MRRATNLFKPKLIIIYILISILITNIEVVYALYEETLNKLTEKETAKNLAEIQNNNININNPNINLPNSVFKGLTNLGVAGAIWAGVSSAATVIKSFTLPLL